MKNQSDFDGFDAFSKIAFPEHKLKVDPYLSRLYRPASLRLSWVLLKTGITPNSITYLQIIVGLLGCYAIYAMQNTLGLAIGVLLLHFAYVLDCVDGEIARATNTESIQGIFLDKFAHAITMPAIFLSVGTYVAALHPGGSQWMIILSWLASFATFNPVSRIVLTVVDALLRKGDVEQYNVANYQTSQEQTLNTKATFIKRAIRSVGHPDRSTGIFWVALHLFRHVSYLAGISVLLVLQIVVGSSVLIVTIWMLACLALVLKEAALLLLVVRSGFIEKRLSEIAPTASQPEHPSP
ncbi:MAG: CDP-alcohol phosphatidyltransferase family protein [Pacificibacter sp.]|uniref:CDP-alcohol phosphatidyltransferase family protein n=1 Tax=Pacificibacter sp. TaxID=1917866 RepID=UPI00321BCA35